MSIMKTALLFVLGGVCVSSAFPGVWRRHHPDMDPRYKEWAHFAISSQVEDRTNFDTLMTLISVESQVTRPQDVTSLETSSKEQHAAPKRTSIVLVTFLVSFCFLQPYMLCTAVVNYRPWEHKTSLKSYNCSDRVYGGKAAE
ncbi:cystatin, putative [Ixodes scapularis]|uniref:Cystatin, putative n=1 Tax=Ixodes scapularis TaxID=6945 RepID=B7Q7D4_IXOSC|nr:cystatin, putative [Ixodes scapularis]|eukprot:XP_002403914.1 cystatin, putative [Ixodes scapularis]